MKSKSRKALSPVVASMILIAVTVAVSIAVAAWMGALTFTFMYKYKYENEIFVVPEAFNATHIQIHGLVSNQTGISELPVTIKFSMNYDEVTITIDYYIQVSEGLFEKLGTREYTLFLKKLV